MKVWSKWYGVLLVCLLVAAVSSLPAKATPHHKHLIAAAELSGLFHSNTNSGQHNQVAAGVYYELLSRILSETGLAAQYDIVVLPIKRAKIGFARRQFACYAPGLDTFEITERQMLPQDILSSSAFNYATVKVLSRHNEPLVHNINDISARDVVSAVRGVPMNSAMQQMMDNALKSYLVTSENENLQMLISGRVNHIMVFYPDVLSAYQQLGITRHFPFSPEFAPLTIRDNLVCHSEHQQAFTKIEAAILRFQQQGLLKKILQEYYLPPDFLPSSSPPAATTPDSSSATD